MKSSLKSSSDPVGSSRGRERGKVRRRIQFKQPVTDQSFETGAEVVTKKTAYLGTSEGKSRRKHVQSRCSLSVVCAWTLLTALIVAATLAVVTRFALSSDSIPSVLSEHVEACMRNKIPAENDCFGNIVKYRAINQIMFVNSDLAKSMVPEKIRVVSIFGKTAAAVQVSEILTAEGKKKVQVEIMLLVIRGAGGFLGSWIIDSYVDDVNLSTDLRRLEHKVTLLGPEKFDTDVNCSGINTSSYVTLYESDQSHSQTHSPAIERVKVRISGSNLVQQIGSLQNHSLYYFSGTQGNRFYVYQILSSVVWISSSVDVRVQPTNEGQDKSRLSSLIESGLYIPYAIVFDQSMAAVLKPQVLLSEDEQKWVVST
mmetsp:Transcript_5772/g.7548  ORF Transcript_5772/g.7548 Transcript_5772/m.7548 type:complete len:369 (+) Transcript_5772:136-1242(+)